MKPAPEATPAGPDALTESEAFPEVISTANPMIGPGDALEVYRAFDDGVLAEVPHALEAFISHQRFALN